MTLQEILENVIMDIDEDITDTEVTDKVIKFINRGYKELAKREYLEKSTTLTFTDGQAKKPIGCFEVVGVYEDNVPIVWNIKGQYIVADTEIAEVIYNYIPDILEDLEDETETNESNIDFIIYYAEYLYYKMEGLFDEMNIVKNDLDSFKIVRPQAKIEKIIDVYGGIYV